MIPSAQDKLPPSLSRHQMIEVDRLMVEDFKISLIQMMELAGRHLAHLARKHFLAGDARDHHIAVLAGSGGNGGGVLVAARRLAAWGAKVQVFLPKPPEQNKGGCAHQLQIIRAMQVPILGTGVLPNQGAFDLVIDGLIGYNLQGAPRGRIAEMITSANAQDTPVLSLDMPSGLDPDEGSLYEPLIQAAATLTLALPKKGFCAPAAQKYLGELYLADIGVPPALYRSAGLNLDIPSVFALAEIVRIGSSSPQIAPTPAQ